MGNRLSPQTLLLIFIVIAVIFVLWRSQQQQPPPERRYEHSRSYEGREPHRHEEGRESGRRERGGGDSEEAQSCDVNGITCSSEYLAAWQQPEQGGCNVGTRNGYPMPDPHCTPGGIDTSVTVEVLRNPDWRTRCIRNCESSEAQKHITYGWYNAHKPKINSEENQVCELDHLVPLELGGADGLGNIWPECGPDDTVLKERYFKIKDRVENYLAEEVKQGHIPLAAAQRGIAEDWTQFLPAANQYCASGGHCG